MKTLLTVTRPGWVSILLLILSSAPLAAAPVLSVESVSVDESLGYADIPVTLSQPLSREVTVYMATSRRTALPGEDYYGTYEMLTFPPGATQQSVRVTILVDKTSEPREEFDVRLLNSAGADLGSQYRATVAITEPAYPLVSISSLTVKEGDGRVRIPVTLNRPGQSTVSVQVATAGETAQPGKDFFGTHETVQFLAGEVSQYVDLEIVDDTEFESTERLTLRLFDSIGAELDEAIATLAITDDDEGNDGRLVRVNPGDDLVRLAAESPESTRFLLTKGTHRLSHRNGVQPRNGQQFTGEDGAVIDGEYSARFAFFNRENAASRVVIENLEVRHFVPGVHWGAIEFDTVTTIPPGQPGYETSDYGPRTDWTLQNLWVHHNQGDGINVGSGARLFNVRSNYNTWLGIGGHGENIRIDGGELVGNSAAAIDQGWVNYHSGGMKVSRAKDIVVSNMLVAMNAGPGLWFDLAVRNATINNNYIIDNVSRGIFYEISYDGVIRDNVVLRSGRDDPTPVWIWPAGILVSTSTNVRVEGNHVAGALGGISIIDQRDKRAEDYFYVSPPMRDPRPYRGTISSVIGNTICSGGVDSGAGTDASTDDVYETSRWRANRYHATKFRFRGRGGMTFSQWRDFGNDSDADARQLAVCPDAVDPRG